MLGVSQVIAISALPNGDSFYALRCDGLVFACGDNDDGQLGDNCTVDRSTFVQAVGISQVVALGQGFVLQAGGHVYAVGYNQGQQLGDGTITNRSSFVKVY
jgi:alpha-tubulin suppressor-like RCC1 family protein